MRLTDEQIGAELRALRSEPDMSFADKLDRRARVGFPAPERKAGNPALSWRVLTPVVAGLAAIAVVVVINSNSTEFESNDALNSDSPAQGPAAAQTRDLRKASPGIAGAPSVSPAPPVGSRPRTGHPQVQELSASLGLSTDADEIQGAADGVVDVTDRYDGFVDSSDVHVGGSNGHAFFSLRIPATDLRNALDDLSGLGRVTTRDEGSANVTGAYVDAGKAYRDARAKVDSLLAQLRSASTPSEAAAIRQQLVPARQQLAAARAALRGVKGRVTYAPVSVQIRADGDGSWSIGDAAGDAGEILKAIAGGTLVTLAVVLPLAALLALGWLGTRELNRRRREAALD
jgi:hypothetical protein